MFIMANKKIGCIGWMICSRWYSQYPTYFKDPIFRKEKQKELIDRGEFQSIVNLPMKAPNLDQTSSVLYDEQVRKFIRLVMRDGNKELARGMIEKAFENVKRSQLERYHKAETNEEKSKIETNPLKIFHTAIENCKPIMKVTPIKRGGLTYQVPMPLSDSASLFRAMKWLIEAAKDKERTIHFPEKLAWELLDAHRNQGRVVKRKIDLHRQCEENRAYVHYRWS